MQQSQPYAACVVAGGHIMSCLALPAFGSANNFRETTLLLFLALIFFFAVPSFGGMVYFGGLGTSQSEAMGVSPDGSVIVGLQNRLQAREAMRWQDGQSLGLGQMSGGRMDSIARAVSDNGVIVGRSRSTAAGPDSYEAFRWQDGVMTGLGALPGASLGSEAWGVSANGSIIVGVSQGEAFRWEGNEMTGLGDLPGGQFRSFARDVSASGSVVVGKAESSWGTEAFRWEDGIMTGLGDLPGGLYRSEALAVSADGLVVVGMSDAGYGQTTAFRWEDGVMTSLGSPPGGSGFSIARAVSGDGSVIIGDASMSIAMASGPFIFTEKDGMRSLTDVLEGLGLDTSDWWLEHAMGVSDDGRTIVGYGIHSGQTVQREVWVAVIPEPHTFAVLLFGGLVVSWSRGPKRV